MSVANAILLFTMIWFLVFFVALAMPFRTQGEAGDVVPGTPSSAPAKVNLGRRARFTTAVAVVLFGCAWAVIELGLIHGPSLEDVPMGPAASTSTSGG
jgi:predicted secreted protein